MNEESRKMTLRRASRLGHKAGIPRWRRETAGETRDSKLESGAAVMAGGTQLPNFRSAKALPISKLCLPGRPTSQQREGPIRAPYPHLIHPSLHPSHITTVAKMVVYYNIAGRQIGSHYVCAISSFGSCSGLQSWGCGTLEPGLFVNRLANLC